MGGGQCVPAVSAGFPVAAPTGRNRLDDFVFPVSRTYRVRKKVVWGVLAWTLGLMGQNTELTKITSERIQTPTEEAHRRL